ncbi:MAG: hypothetical protein KJ000_06690 [Pirellulaceae bacterium]|nr:hypothetical protein [Pirellulaceae bacterium]
MRGSSSTVLVVSPFGKTLEDADLLVGFGQFRLLPVAVFDGQSAALLAVLHLLAERRFERFQGEQILQVERSRSDGIAQTPANPSQLGLQIGQRVLGGGFAIAGRQQLLSALVAMDFAQLQDGL